MNLGENLRAAKEKLKEVTISRTLETGEVVNERRTKDGQFEVVQEASQLAQPSADNDVTVSKRRIKAVQRAHRFGFVVDLKPDLQVACVSPGLYLSSQDVAQDLDLLRENKITHIVNVATSVNNAYPKHFVYLALNVVDFPSYNLKQHFDEVLTFMRGAILEGGRVLVHCNAGVSRSSTLVIAYVMRYEEKGFEQAFHEVKQIRKVVQPNPGFMKQLKEFEGELNMQRTDSSKI